MIDELEYLREQRIKANIKMLFCAILLAVFVSGVFIGTKRGNTIVKYGNQTISIPFNSKRVFTITLEK